MKDDEYEVGLKRQKRVVASQNAADNLLLFYAEQRAVCDAAYDYYKAYEDDKELFIGQPRRISRKGFRRLLGKNPALVLTANPIEEAILLHWLYDCSGGSVDCYLVNDICLNLALYKNLSIVHVHTRDTGEEFARVALNKACKVFCPSYVFLLGICYGIDRTRHKVGSVFVSDEIITFRLNFRDDVKTGSTRFEVREEYRRQPGNAFIEAMSYRLNYMQTKSILSTGETRYLTDVTFGKILCCNSLMDSGKVKASVIEQLGQSKPFPLGGEMEGAGVIKSYLTEELGVDKWAIVKSVCDWGEQKNSLHEDEGLNERIKDSIQAYAMSTACGAFDNIIGIL